MRKQVLNHSFGLSESSDQAASNGKTSKNNVWKMYRARRLYITHIPNNQIVTKKMQECIVELKISMRTIQILFLMV